MYFKFSKTNPYREFVAYAHQIAVMQVDEDSRSKLYRDLYRIAAPKLMENERLLNSSPAFAQRCAHWNQREVESIKPVRNEANPWLRFKREFEKATQSDINSMHKLVQTALAWFYYNPYKEDWINS